MSAPSSAPSSAIEAAFQIAAYLEASEVDYAIGGALAYGIWGVPRDTVDVDINLFVDTGQLDQVFAALQQAGITVDEDAARKGHADGGFFQARLGVWRVDIFTPSIPFSWEAGRTRVRIGEAPLQAWFLSAEAVALFKLLFFRGKDRVDLERLVATQGNKLDQAYVRRWIVEMMGEDDARTVAWDDIVARFGGK